MESEIFFFDHIEFQLIEAADLAIRYAFDYDEPLIIEINKYDNYLKSSLLAESQNFCYDIISNKSNSFLHRFLSISQTQAISHLPELRADVIRNLLLRSLCGGTPNRNLDESELSEINELINSYKKHFPLYVEFIQGLNTDFKAGLLGTHTPQIVSSDSKESRQVKYASFDHYLKQFKYNYPYKIAVFDFKFSMRDYFDYLKTEILDNLLIINKDDRKAYLNKLKYELESKKRDAYVTQSDIDKWLKKYEIESEEAIRIGKGNNELYNILTSDPPTLDDEFEDNFNRDTQGIQNDFYNFYYGFYVDEAIVFIDKQILEHYPDQVSSTTSNPAQQPKLKTNLSVPQLALLFKMLNDLKPDIFDVKSEAELHRFISATFETKKSKEEGISTDKLRILFNRPDSNAAEFWEKNFYTLVTEVKKFK